MSATNAVTAQNLAPSETINQFPKENSQIKDTENSVKQTVKIEPGTDFNSFPQEEAEKQPPFIPEPFNVLETLSGVLFRSTNQIEKPDAIISIDGNILATAGNLITIVGQAKAGKSGVTVQRLYG